MGNPDELGANSYGAKDGEAEMRTDGGGSMVGSPPGASSNDPPGYDYIRYLGMTNTWVRFHLINEKAGGPGEPWNLVPASGSDNGKYENAVEENLKDRVDKARNAIDETEEVYFGVKVDFNAAPGGAPSRQNDATPKFPKSLKYWLSTQVDGDWTAEASGAKWDFSSTVPIDNTAPIDISVPGNVDTVEALLKQSKIASAWAHELAAWLHSHHADLNGWAGYSVENLADVISVESLTGRAMDDNDVNEAVENDVGKLESFAALIKYGRVHG
jgi:hypothetical protein